MPDTPAFLRRVARRPSGSFIATGPDGVDEGDTLMCVHCQMHWRVEPGSGRRRGFCFKCNGPTCGKPACDTCTPWEKRLEEIERAARRA